MIVDLEIGEQEAARGFIQRERFLEAQVAAIKIAGGGQVIGLEPDMGHAHDIRPLYFGGLGERPRGGDGRTTENSAEHFQMVHPLWPPLRTATARERYQERSY